MYRSRKKSIKKSPNNGKPLNMTLYNNIKSQAKLKFKVWPSAYASGWLVKEYKRKGGKYEGKKPTKLDDGLTRWFEEKWINVCKLPRKVPCGRPTTDLSTWKSNYPYCRPDKRVTKKSPKTVSELSKNEIKHRCSNKKKSPMKRLLTKKSKSVNRRKSTKNKK